MAKRTPFEDLYPLSPMQEGMLSHTLLHPEETAYVGQFGFTLGVELDLEAFRRAWQGVVDRHPALRTSFVWEKVEKPLQVVRRRAVLPFHFEDLRGLPEDGRDSRLAEYGREERARGFDLSQAPLMRLALFRTGDARYRLLWTHHHLVLDGWSLSRVYRDVATLYEAFAAGRELELPEARPYRDYIQWLQRQDLVAAEAFWRRELEGVPAPTPLGIGGEPGTPPRPELRGGKRRTSLPAATAEAIQALARRAQVTLNTVVQGAWALLLSRYSGERDVLFGTTVSGRPAGLKGADETVGMFINTLPVRVRVLPGQTVLPWLEALQRQQTALREWEFTPLVQVQKWAGVPAGQPLFESLFTFENYPVDPSSSARDRFGVSEVWGVEDDGLPLSFSVMPRGGGIELELAWGGGRFHAAEAERMLGHLAAVLEAFAADPERSLDDVSHLGAGEREGLLELGRGEAGGYDREATVHALLAGRTAAWPDAPAVVCGARTVSFAELDAAAGRLARRLRARGVGPEVRVGVFLERSVELAVALLGVLRAGGAYVPLDPEYPRERLSFLAADSGAPLIVTRASLLDALPECAAEALCVDDPAGDDGSDDAPDSPSVPCLPESLAYAIYTSGSTGRPKAAMISHRSLLCFAEAMRAELALGVGDRILQFASPSFDVMVEEIFPAWLAGAAVVFPEGDLLGSPAGLLEVVEAQGVTGFELPTAYWHEWVRTLAEDGTRLPECVRFVIVGGERVLPERLRAWARLGVPLVHVFGLTETAVTTTTLRLEAGDDGARWQNLPVGRPLPGAVMYVLDERMEPVPPGVPGQLFVGGDGVGRGYQARPDLTAERFVPDPFAEGQGARLYRTGDRVRWLEGGELEFLGRTDFQVKIRGFRIEPAEVEAAICAHPEVREAAVVVREDAPGRKRLVAYVALPDGARDSAPLREHLRGRLPEYMVPGAFVFLDALPLSPNGKIDRRALPDPERETVGGEDAYEAPRTPVEEALASVWQAVLGVERVGVHDNFFELGGDSILSIQVVSRARRAGVHLRPKQLFLRPTVAKLARVAAPDAEPVRPEPEAADDAVELTPIQQWFFSEPIPERHHWNMSLLLRVRRPVDPEHLEGALRAVVAHHDALRLRYARTSAGGWSQRVGPPDEAVPFERVDLSGVPARELEAAITRRAAEVQRTLDLERGPLLRAVLLETGEGRDDRLLLAAHHLAVDAVTWRILGEDVQAVYEQLERGEPVSLPPATTSLRRWARRLAEHTARGGFDGEISYWTAGDGPEPRPLPVDAPEGARENRMGTARTVSVTLPAESTRALLQRVPAAYRTRVGDVLLTALVRALAGWTGEPRVRVELEGHGREEIFDDVDLSRTAGWFTSVYPVLLDVRGAPGEGAALKRVKEQLRAVPGQGIGFGALRWLHPDPAVRERLAGAARAGVSFNYLGQVDASTPESSLFELAPEPAGPGTSPRAPRPHLLDVVAVVQGGELRIDWTYGETVHLRPTVERVAGRYVAELEALIAHCTSEGAGGFTPSDFPLAGLDAERLDALLAGERDVEDVYPVAALQEGMLFHTLYEPGAGVYLAQLGFDLLGTLDVEAFRRAWQGVLDRHAALRTGYATAGLDRPLQVVRRRADMPVLREDWRGLDEGERTARLEAYLRDDRARGVDPLRPPLMRMALFRLADDTHHMVWTFHQMVLDGWSLPIVFGEVAALYEGFVRGAPARLEEPGRYRDYVAWLAGRDAARAEAYWRGALGDVEAPTPLAILPPAAEGDAGGDAHEKVNLYLPADRTTRLQRAAREQGLTLNTLVQGAWALLLSRYSGEEAVVFGATSAGRPAELPGVERMVGMFLSTPPVRVAVRPGARVGSWLAELQEAQAELREHEHVPLVQLQAWSGVTSGTPLFESIVVFENYPMEEALRGREDVLRIRRGENRSRSNFPLTLVVVPGERLRFRLEYDRGRFDGAAVERLLEHLAAALEGIATLPGAELREIGLLASAGRAQVLGEWNATEAAYPADLPVHRLVQEQAARTPDAVALASGERTLTYAELDRAANRLAHALRRRGVGPEHRVALLLERSPELVVALLATLRAGGAYVPLEVSDPAERIAGVLEDAGVSLLLTAGRHAPPPGGVVAEVFHLDAEADAVAREPDDAPEVDVRAENAAYLVYTSGSTGRPKGVVVEHRHLANYVHAVTERLGLRAGLRHALVSTVAADLGNTVLFPALCTGGTLHVVPEESTTDGRAFAAYLERHAVDVVKIVPSHLAALLDGSGDVGGLPRRLLVLGGEASRAEWVGELKLRAPELEVVNHYGPTETTVGVLTHRAGAEGGRRTVPLGLPLGNSRAYVLDAAWQPVPVGVAGELYVGGSQVARGYAGRPEQTAERFLPDPFAPASGARMYRTGDRVRRLPDGTLEFLGRVDAQVKMRGFRVEPGEVEAALRGEAGVREAVVAVRREPGGDTRLVGYVVAGADVDGAGLRGRLRERLPGHMVPAAVVVLDAIPRIPNGKVDLRALPAPAGAAADEAGYVAPRTPVEEVLAEIWAEVLGVPRVGAHDDFFELGGHSLLAMRVTSRVREAFGAEVSLRALFEAPTVAGLAREVDSARGAGAALRLPPIERVPRDGAELPLSFGQQRLWFIDQFEPGSSAYHQPHALRVHGPLDARALARSLDEVVRRHEVLRTTYSAVQGRAVQVVGPARPLDFPVVDLCSLPRDGRETHVRTLAAEEAARPFDLARGPLLRATLLRLEEADHVLLFNLHHIASDGWSMGVLVREVTVLYGAFAAGEAAVLPELPVQYADYAAWQRRWLTGETLERQLDFWRGQMAGAPPVLDLPTDRPRPAASGGRGASFGFVLSPELSEGVRALARREGATLFMALLAAWQGLLGRYAGQEDVVVGTPVAGRTRTELEGLIGFFVNTLALRADLTGRPGFRALLAQVRERMLGAYQHQELPFEKLVDELGVERSLAHTPLFQAMFALHNNERAELALGESRLEALGGATGAAKFDLALDAWVDGEAIRGIVAYRAELWAGATMERLLEHFRALLRGVVSDPRRPLADISFLSEAERTQLLDDWSGTARPAPVRPLVHDLFAAQAARTPESAAVLYDGEEVTYAELDRRANRLAHALRRRGVGPENRVGVYLERTPELPVALLGILKSGGAYVPLDPAYPPARLAHMLEDAGVDLVLTRASLAPALPAGAACVLALDVERDAIAGEPDHAPARSGLPESLAYVIYTSGSTGRPKGVGVPHAAAAAHLDTFARELEIVPADRVLHFASFGFDVSIEQLFLPLLSGASAVLRGGEPWSPAEWPERARALGITVANLPPAYWQEVVETAAGSGLPELRLLLVGADVMPSAAVTLWRSSVASPARLLNAYGPTETVVTATAFHIPEEYPAGYAGATVPLGHPLPGRAAYVLDAGGAPVPPGVPGELHLGGPLLARGYLGRPDLTAERFVPDLFSAAPGARLYRTGDRVRWLASGELEYQGRMDQQVKLRGFRIEPGEIEAALREHPAVREAAVVLREDSPGSRRLVAYLVGERPAVAVEEVRGHLRARLPEYMVPAGYVVLDALPLNASGKLDRRALPAPEWRSREEPTAPRTPEEEALARVWAEVLRLERVGVEENFFELGGDSILSIQVVARARREGLRLTPRQLFEHPTVAGLARVAGTREEVQADQGIVAGPAPLTPIQHWFFTRRFLDPNRFNQAVTLRVGGRVDVSALEASIERLGEHHDALRSRFSPRDGDWSQRIAGGDCLTRLERFDLSGEEDRAAALRRASDDLHAGLDIEAGPLARFALVEFGEGEQPLLLIVAHHLVVDGVSWRILLEDLQTAYEQARRGEAVVLPPKTTSFRDWATRLETYAGSGGPDEEAAHWLEALAGDAPALPVDYPDGENRVGSARTVAVELTVEETRALLQDVPAAYRTQIGEVLLAALAAALHPWSGSRAMLVDLEGHGREDLFTGVDLTRTVGWFTSVYPVRLELPEGGGRGDALKAVKEQLRGVPGNGLRYGVLRYMGPAAVRQALKGLPRAGLSFNYLGQFDQVFPVDATFVPVQEAGGASQGADELRERLIDVGGAVSGGRLRMQWTYSESLHRRETVERLAAAFVAELRALVEHCASPEAGGFTPSDFPLARLSQAELDALVGADRAVQDVYPLTPMQEGMLFHTLYEPSGGAYVGQFEFGLEGALDPRAFERAWQGVLDRHEALRSRFAWEGLRRPLQVVGRSVPLPLAQEDWRTLAPVEQDERMAAYLRADRERGFAPERAPLMRVALFRTGETSHRMVWSHHHILLDGWSLPLLLRDVLTLYRAFARGREPQPTDSRPYRDYIAWLERQEPVRAERFWRDALAGFAAPTALGMEPTGAPGTPIPAYGAREFHLPVEPTAALQAFARRHALTLNTVVHAAWALLLSRYAGEEDVLFGMTVSGRPAELPGVERMVGLFINTLPVRVRVPAGAPVLAWTRDLQDRLADLREFEHTPLVRIQGWSELGAGSPLFDSLVAFENYPLGEALESAEPDDLKVHRRHGAEQTTYPLTLTVGPERELRFKAIYDARRFEAPAIDRMLRHLSETLRRMESGPNVRLDEVALLSEAERRQVLEEWNAAGAKHGEDACIHHLLSAQAERTPDAVAIICGVDELTYSELGRRTRRVARLLRQRGVEPGVRVGLCVERGRDMVVGMLSILEAGGAYVPLDPAYPRERLAFMLEDSGARVLLTQEQLIERIPPHGADVVCLDREESASEAGSPSLPPSDVGPADLAYVIYTSGSTGRPKGVMIEHRSTVALLRWAREVFSPGELAGVLASTSICFDLSVFEIFLPLSLGTTVVVAENALALPGLPARERVTLLNTVPSAAAELVRTGGIPSSVTTVVLAGEPLKRVLADALYSLPNVSGVYNLYGPSEDTTYSTGTRVEEATGRAPTIGRPISGTRAYLLDRHLNPVPAGVPGELYLAGAGLARGYHERPELTAERFVPDPFAAAPGGRLYRTGDLARWREDGEIEFLGRADHQVKVRGFRIELGEIEAALLRHPGVREAVAVAREDVPGEKRLVAYLGGAPEVRADASRLRAYLKECLPEPMVPGFFVWLDALPLTPNGKVDRAALPAPEAAVAEAAGRVAPRDPAEELLAAIWGEVLGAEEIGVHDDFFDLGGHSLLAVRVTSRIRESLGVDLPLRALFEAPTVAELAVRTAAALAGGGHAPPPPLRQAPRDGALPLSFAQQRLWFLDQLLPGNAAFNMSSALRIHGSCDAAALGRSLDDVVRRHESLRTVFATADGSPVQVVGEPHAGLLRVVDLQGRPGVEDEVRRMVEEEAGRPFDLGTGPLLRAILLRLEEEEAVLLFTIHHIVSDAWSMGVLVREVSALYAGHVARSRAELPELPVQYADYAAWQRDFLKGETLERQVDFWREQLRGAPPLLELPTDRPRSGTADAAGTALPFVLDAPTSAALRHRSRQLGATPFMALLAGFQALLARYSGQEDVSVGVPVAGRTHTGLEGLIGFFVNTLVLRSDLSGEPSFSELLERVRETTLGAFAHQDVPFERLVDELQVERSLAHTPLFQVLFSLRNVEPAELSLGGAVLEGMDTRSGSVQFDLSLDLASEGGAFAGSLTYRAGLWDADTMQRMAEHLRILFEEAVADPGRPLGRVGLLRAAEREQVLVRWNATAAEYGPGPVHQLVSAWARRTPEAVAVLHGERFITYAELDRRANQLAHHLRRWGVGPEVRVGLCVERGPEMIVAVLGIWKAGGAYVPLDPEYPRDRLAFLLGDSAVPVLVTRAHLRERLPDHGAVEVHLDAHAERIEQEPECAPEVGTELRGLAYVIYTSGSTGWPKGVQVDHGSLTNLLQSCAGSLGMEAGEEAPTLASFAFDIWLVEALLPLVVGARTRIVSRPWVLDASAALEEMRHATLLHAVPALMRQLLAAARERGHECLASVRRVYLGGEAVPPDLLAEVREVLPRAELYVLYGPTEASVLAAVHRVPGVEVLPGHRIGRPLGNVRLYVCDEQGNPQPVGVPGELWIGGAGVARGYLGRPELSAERFVPDGFGGAAGARLYRTGDRVRWRAEGELEFLGRMDQQVKVRGFRVEPGEVEAALKEHPGVADAVVSVQEDRSGERRLVAYVTADGNAPSGMELREHLRHRLAEYMVPSAYVALPAFPLTPHGKVDRKRLPAADAAEAGREYVAPRGGDEEAVAAIWAEVLGVERVGAEDNFFQVGGHSLLATQVVSRTRRAFRLDVPLRLIYEAPTVERFAAALATLDPDDDAFLDAPALGRGEVDELLSSLDTLSEDDLDRLLDNLSEGTPS